MSDRTETHSDFAWPAAETPWADGEGRPTVNPAPARAVGRHPFQRSANPRHSACERCGRPREAHSPELHRTSVVGHLNLAIKSVREGDLHMAAIHVGTAQKLLDGDD